MCMCVCVCASEASDMMWTLYNWLNKFYSCYMVTVVIIINGHSFGIGTHRRH